MSTAGEPSSRKPELAFIPHALKGWVILSGMTGVFLLDLVTPRGIAEVVLYLPATIAAYYWKGKRALYAAIGVVISLAWIGFWFSPGGEDESAIVNRALFSLSALVLGPLCWWIDQYRLRLAKSEGRFHALFDRSSVGMCIVDCEKRYLKLNRAYCLLLGYEEEELLGHPFTDVTHPEDLAENLALWAQFCCRGSVEYRLEKRYIRKDGTVIWVKVTANSFRAHEQEEPLVVAIIEDITERKQAEAFHFAEKQVLDAVAFGSSLPDVLAYICRSIEAVTAPMICSIMLVSRDGRHLEATAGPSLPAAYLKAADGVPIGPTAGSCGSAAFHKKLITVSDIATDPLWEGFRHIPLAHGLRACWSTPIIGSDGELLGTFAAYYREPRAPQDADIKIVERAGHLARIAIQRANSYEALRESEERFQAFMTHSPAVAFIKDESSRILYVNPTFERLFRVSLDQVRGNGDLPWLSEALMSRLRANDRAVLNSGRPIEVEETVPSIDGTIQHWLVLKFPLRAASGQQLLGGMAIDITSRKRAEEALQLAHAELEVRVAERTAALRLSEQRYASLLNSVDAIVWEADPVSLNTTFVNCQAERMLGYPLQRWVGEPSFWGTILHPDDRERVVAQISECEQMGNIRHLEYRMTAADGRTVWVKNHITLNSDEDCPPRLLGVIVDISELKRAESRLRTTQFAVDHTSEFVFVIDRDGRFLDVNESACRRLGYTKTELLTLSVMDINPDLSPSAWASAWEELKRQEQLRRETRHRTKSGEVYPVEVVAQYVSHEQREMSFAFVRDISDRKRAERMLQITKFTMDRAANAIFWVDPTGDILYANEEACRVLGYSDKELVGKRVFEIDPNFPPNAWPAHWEELKHRGHFTFESAQITKGGVVRRTEVTVNHLVYDGQEYNCAVVRDITERKRLEEELARHAEDLERQVQQRIAEIARLETQRAQAEKLAAVGQLAAGVAHEINNPIAGIKNAFMLVKQAVDRAHPHYEFVGLIDREIDRVAAIVRNMYQLYRRESRWTEAVDVVVLIRDIESLFAKRLSQQGLRLVTEVEDSIKLYVPQGDLLQVLLNLVQNAIDSSRPGDTITLAVREEPDAVRIRVIDHGSGIQPDVLPHIFDPFFTTKNDGTHKGMGLGLSVSQALVQAMGGTLEGLSEWGRGATFTIVLPRGATAPGQGQKSPTLVAEELSHGR